MSAEGKVNTVHLKVRDRVMVCELRREDGVIIADASRTKTKGAMVMTVYAVPTWERHVDRYGRIYGRYRIDGIADDGTKVRIAEATGNQTFWLAKS